MHAHLPTHQKLASTKAGAGFTVIELMVAVAIAAILAALAAPSFSQLIANQKAKSVASDLFSSMAKARNEAIARNSNVTLAQKTGGWQQGWQISDANNAVLDDRSATSNVFSSGSVNIVFRPSGRVQGTTTPKIVIEARYGDNSVYQCVSVDLTGRPYKAAGSSC